MEISEGQGQVFVREGVEIPTTSSTAITSPPSTSPTSALVTSSLNMEIPGVAKSVWQGSMFWKIPFNTNSVARKRWFQVVRPDSASEALLTWSDPSKTKEKPRTVKLSEVTAIKRGHSTTAFFNQVSVTEIGTS